MSSEVFRAIDGLKLPAEHRALLRPGESESDSHENVHHLPRFFYEVASWQEAHEVRLAPHFKLAELMTVDCREAEPLLREFPHYVPCAIILLARFLEDFRREVDAPIFVSANGGYRRLLTRSAAPKAFMPGVQLRIFTESATPFSMTQNQ